jgi:hypothetical protein
MLTKPCQPCWTREGRTRRRGRRRVATGAPPAARSSPSPGGLAGVVGRVRERLQTADVDRCLYLRPEPPRVAAHNRHRQRGTARSRLERRDEVAAMSTRRYTQRKVAQPPRRRPAGRGRAARAAPGPARGPTRGPVAPAGQTLPAQPGSAWAASCRFRSSGRRFAPACRVIPPASPSITGTHAMCRPGPSLLRDGTLPHGRSVCTPKTCRLSRTRR